MKWISPIGLFVPPSYLNKLFLNYPKTLRFFEKRDEKASNSFFLSALSDHYLISLNLR